MRNVVREGFRDMGNRGNSFDEGKFVARDKKFVLFGPTEGREDFIKEKEV